MAVAVLVVMIVSVRTMTVAMAVAVTVAVTMSMATAATFFVIMCVEALTQMEMSIAGVQYLDLNEIEDKAHYSHKEHKFSLYHWWHEETVGGLLEEPDCHDPNTGDGNECAHELSSVPTKTEMVICLKSTQFNTSNSDTKAE